MEYVRVQRAYFFLIFLGCFFFNSPLLSVGTSINIMPEPSFSELADLMGFGQGYLPGEHAKISIAKMINAHFDNLASKLIIN